MNQFKRAQVVMLPAKEVMDAYKASITKVYEDEGKLYLNKKERGELITELGSPQYLYIVSDDEIKEGDWFITPTEETNQYICKAIKHNHNTLCKKIIATDASLLNQCVRKDGTLTNNYSNVLPQPSQQFIEKYSESYNKGEVITDVLVEYQKIATYNTGEPCLIIKLDKNNIITIKKLKNSWSREEVIELVTKAFKAGYERSYSCYPNTDNYTKLTIDKWIEVNL